MTQKIMTRQEIAAKAPAVLETGVSSNVSAKYVHVPTIELIDDMEKLGWNVVDVKQVGSKKAGANAYKKHLVTFRNEEVVIKSEDGETVYPQILLSNSHDGLSAFTFRAGLFRLVCTNGLVIATKEFGAVSVRHKGYSFEELKEIVMGLVEKLPVTVETLNRFREVILTEDQKVEFALAALGIRFGENGAEVAVEDILKPIRKEDEGDELWKVFNVIQEKFVRGGTKYQSKKGRLVTMKELKNFHNINKINTSLWELADSYCD